MAMTADNNNKETLQEADKLLAFTQHALTHQPIELAGDAQHGLHLLLDSIREKITREE